MKKIVSHTSEELKTMRSSGESKTDWERVRRDSAADAPIYYDPEVDPYDPNDAAAVEAYWSSVKIIRGPGRPKLETHVATPENRPFTSTALRGGLELGLTESEMRVVVIALSQRNFYKSMTTHADHREWQDVYHDVTDNGVEVYIKITAHTDGRPPVIQFKAK